MHIKYSKAPAKQIFYVSIKYTHIDINMFQHLHYHFQEKSLLINKWGMVNEWKHLVFCTDGNVQRYQTDDKITVMIHIYYCTWKPYCIQYNQNNLCICQSFYLPTDAQDS